MNKIVTTALLLSLSMISFPSHAQVDYEDDIQPIFDQSCVSCHSSSSGIDFSNYQAVMESVSDQYGSEIVIPGEPDESPLVDKIEPTPQQGSRMPQGGPYLSSDEIDLIRTWIAEGANEMAVSNELITEVPSGFEMIGNYPNPFNPKTTISFATPQTANYSLIIYNSSGVMVQELSGSATTPRTDVSVLMNELPSGIYLYRVKILTGNHSFFLETKKMALTK